MTPQLQKYYEERFDMMSSQGWKDLLDDIQKMYEATNDLSSVQDEKTLHFRRGELSIMRWMLNIAGLSKDAYDVLVLQQAETITEGEG